MKNIIARYYKISTGNIEETTTDLDSHADSLIDGDNATIIFHTNKTVRVSAFTKAPGNITNVPIVVE